MVGSSHLQVMSVGMPMSTDQIVYLAIGILSRRKCQENTSISEKEAALAGGKNPRFSKLFAGRTQLLPEKPA